MLRLVFSPPLYIVRKTNLCSAPVFVLLLINVINYPVLLFPCSVTDPWEAAGRAGCRCSVFTQVWGQEVVAALRTALVVSGPGVSLTDGF